MVNYQCYRCGYTILNKTKIIKNVLRITPCTCKEYQNIIRTNIIAEITAKNSITIPSNYNIFKGP